MRIGLLVATALLVAGCAGFQPGYQQSEIGQPMTLKEIVTVCSAGYEANVVASLVAALEARGGKISGEFKDDFTGAVVRRTGNIATSEGVQLYDKYIGCVQPLLARREQTIDRYLQDQGVDPSRTVSSYAVVVDHDIRFAGLAPPGLFQRPPKDTAAANYEVRIRNNANVEIECRVQIYVDLYDNEDAQRRGSSYEQFAASEVIKIPKRQTWRLMNSFAVPAPGNKILTKDKGVKIVNCWLP